MSQSMSIGAWGSFDGDTEIRYSPCDTGAVEILIGGDEGFNLLATDAGINRLAAVIEAARSDEHRLRLLARRAESVRRFGS